jgi:hypothetical protein
MLCVELVRNLQAYAAGATDNEARVMLGLQDSAPFKESSRRIRNNKSANQGSVIQGTGTSTGSRRLFFLAENRPESGSSTVPEQPESPVEYSQHPAVHWRLDFTSQLQANLRSELQVPIRRTAVGNERCELGRHPGAACQVLF